MPARRANVDLVIGTFVLRPYVFTFLAAFLVAGTRDLGGRRVAVFGAWVWPVAWLAESHRPYFGVPLSNFVGWVIVGTVGVGAILRGGRLQSGVTVWIGEWVLAAVGLILHGVLALTLWWLNQSVGARMRFDGREIQNA
jgi:uncharacterized membrane protein